MGPYFSHKATQNGLQSFETTQNYPEIQVFAQ